MMGLYWFEYIVISITVRVYNLNKWSNRILMYAGVTKTIPRYMLHVIVFAVEIRAIPPEYLYRINVRELREFKSIKIHFLSSLGYPGNPRTKRDEIDRR